MDKTITNNKFDFKFGTEVRILDKWNGRLAKVVIDPATWHITDLIVESGFIFKQARVIPAAKVEDILARTIYLAIHSSELPHYPEYQETVVEKGVPEWQKALSNPDIPMPEPHYSLTSVPEMKVVRERIRTGVADDLLLFDSNTPVNGLDDKIGQISHIITDENLQISQLVVAQGKVLPRQIVIPVHLVETISEFYIQISATHDEINELPEFVVLNDKSVETNTDQARM